MNKKTKRIVGMLLSMVMLFSFSMTVSAQENEVEQDDRTYLIVNGEDIVYVGEDYENPETGEYVRWDTSSRGVDKSFSFCIRYSLTTSDFTVHSGRFVWSPSKRIYRTSIYRFYCGLVFEKSSIFCR